MGGDRLMETKDFLFTKRVYFIINRRCLKEFVLNLSVSSNTSSGQETFPETKQTNTEVT